MTTTNIYVLYHAQCTDGTGSKFAAWKKFKNNARYIAVNYGQPLPKMEPDSEVYIVDFSYSKDVLKGLQAIHKTVMVLDHHKTAEEDLKGLSCCHFDMTKSGCVLAWEYFHPNVKIPAVLLDIQDRDLWLFKRPNSKAVHAGINLLEGNMQEWDWVSEGKAEYDELVKKGNTLLKREALIVKSAVKSKVKTLSFCGYKCGITNGTDLGSEIGNAICLSDTLKVDFAVVYCITSNNDVLLSFRSIDEFDVSTLSKKFGGGGHKNAAGAMVSLETLMKILKGDM